MDRSSKFKPGIVINAISIRKTMLDIIALGQHVCPQINRENMSKHTFLVLHKNSSKVLVYRIRKIVGISNFAEQFRKHINSYKRIGCNPYIMRRTACLVVNPITADGYALLFSCTTVVRALDSMTA